MSFCRYPGACRDAAECIAKLEAALREVIAADCCGCSVYGKIAAEALGLSQEDLSTLRHAPSYSVPENPCLACRFKDAANAPSHLPHTCPGGGRS